MDAFKWKCRRCRCTGLHAPALIHTVCLALAHVIYTQTAACRDIDISVWRYVNVKVCMHLLSLLTYISHHFRAQYTGLDLFPGEWHNSVCNHRVANPKPYPKPKASLITMFVKKDNYLNYGDVKQSCHIIALHLLTCLVAKHIICFAFVYTCLYVCMS